MWHTHSCWKFLHEIYPQVITPPSPVVRAQNTQQDGHIIQCHHHEFKASKGPVRLSAILMAPAMNSDFNVVCQATFLFVQIYFHIVKRLLDIFKLLRCGHIWYSKVQSFSVKLLYFFILAVSILKLLKIKIVAWLYKNDYWNLKVLS